MNNTRQVSIVKITGNSVKSVPDWLAVEEPLEIRLAYSAGAPATGRVQNLAVTMRTPGQDADLALGFLFTEGIIAGAEDVIAVEYIFLPCTENRQNTILVTLNEAPSMFGILGIKIRRHNRKRKTCSELNRFVEITGVEPVTFCMPCKRSSQLS
jgi:formate dehydrogenase assembly factor FdhD